MVLPLLLTSQFFSFLIDSNLMQKLACHYLHQESGENARY